MKTSRVTSHFLLLAAAALLASCASIKPGATPAAPPLATTKSSAKTETAPGKTDEKTDEKAAAAAPDDDLDEYAATEVFDPLEKLNRAMFRGNDILYKVLVRPISKGYEKGLPKRLRNGIYNAFENVRFPARFVNCALQGKFKRAGQETGKLVVNSVAGLGGLIRVADKIPALADVPDEDTGQTFAAWGIGHGAYLVLPFFGPSSVREGIGLAGDYALNPVNWVSFSSGDHDWLYAVQGANTVRLMPPNMSAYDAATQDAVDPYISVRSAYIQNRAEAARK